MQEKYEIFLNKHRKGVQQFVLSYKVGNGKHKWCNASCTKAKKEKGQASEENDERVE